LRISKRVIQFIDAFQKEARRSRSDTMRGDNWDEIAKFHRGDQFTVTTMPDGTYLNILTLEGVMQARPGDWIIEGIKGEVYPCKPDIFEAIYEPWIGHPAYSSKHSIDADGHCNMGRC
jgi:hypothetical protein